MQFFAGDKSAAMELSRLICDIEHEVCPWADWAFMARFDCDHDMETVAYMKTKFEHVYTIKGVRRQTGWPQGPNAIVSDLFRLVYEKTTAGEWHYDAVMLAESDDLPLRKTWVHELWMEWHAGTQMILGDWIGSGHDLARSHINGNLLLAPELTRRLPRIWNMSCVPSRGWDAYYWPNWAKWSRPSRLIFSDYRLGTKRHPWLGCDYLWAPKYHRGHPSNPLYEVPLTPCWLHGCKDPEGRQCVREKLLGPPVSV
jgi:hypothetical protein